MKIKSKFFKLFDHQKTIKLFEVTLIVFWLGSLLNSDSFFIPYLITGIASILCCIHRPKINHEKHRLLAIIFSLIFTFSVCSANYSLFPSFQDLNYIFINLITVISLILGSFIAFYNILIYLPVLITKIQITKNTPTSKFYQSKPSVIFFVSFLIITISYLLVLFLCKYPGNLSIDSTRQINQTIINEYSNHHPFIHTVVIGFLINIGQAIFGNLNAGVAFYSVIQILFLAGIFAYSIVTLYQIKCSKSILIILLVFYSLCPYHIMYSMTMWKDVVFGGFALLFVISQYRLFNHLGRNWLNYLLVAISTLGVCLFRNNGFYAAIILFIVFLIFFWRQIFITKKLLINFSILFGSIIFTIIYNTILLPNFKIRPTEITESLSVPVQQIAKTVRDNNLPPEQLELLDHILDTKNISNVYTSNVSDPIKKQIWEMSNHGTFLSEHKSELIKLYLKLGLAHPITYFTAWVDLTRGYYNGGYDHWIIYDSIHDDNLDIARTHQESRINKLFNSYLLLFEKHPVLRIFYCIGFAVWLIIVLLYIAIIKRQKTLIFLISLPLLIIATLLIATPVYSEFRYAYAVFCCLPFLSIVILASPKKRLF